MNIDSLDHHIKHITRQHDDLGIKIDAILCQKSWNEFEVENLKKQKLKLKDDLSMLYKQRYELAQEVGWPDDH